MITITNLKRIAIAAILIALTGCVSVTKVDSGDRAVGERLQLHLDGAWNQINAPSVVGPNCQSWTMEGLTVDQILVYSGLKNDEPIHYQAGGSSEKKVFKFHSNMQPEQIVALYEGMLTRDGSTFTLKKLEPAMFGGVKGFHFEYTLVRKTDNVQISGTGSGAVSKGELFAIVYQAPQLVFYPRHQARVAHIIQSARLKA
ncbi:hypothetical protein [Undibacterium sp.]|uniref:hypothetical protein n=1 Tax=Undibacterium sp. TaxID=1914977 RepID=UPI002C2E5670|nr:hypothetical protein [Undibacterium sp.]HTD07142.1 hypothetical protein [Undibacterium sp.]